MDTSRFLSGLGRLFWHLACLCAAALCVFLGMYYAHVVDWTLLGIGILCLMPVLVLVDVFTMAALVAAGRLAEPGGDFDKKDKVRERQLASLGSLLLVHLFTAALSLFLLAVPASSVWLAGLTLARLRAVLLGLTTLGLLLALPQPFTLANTLLPLVRAKKAPAPGQNGNGVSRPEFTFSQETAAKLEQ